MYTEQNGFEAYLDDVQCRCRYQHHTFCVINITTTCICHKYLVRHAPKQRKLDRLRSESKGATNETPTREVPAHALQTNARWRGVGEVSSACEVGCFRRVQGTAKAVIRRRKTKAVILKVPRLWIYI